MVLCGCSTHRTIMSTKREYKPPGVRINFYFDAPTWAVIKNAQPQFVNQSQWIRYLVLRSLLADGLITEEQANELMP